MNISKLTLGTVQLGLNYGIANKGGQHDAARSRALLSYALKNAVTSLDTAREYGSAEQVIGGFDRSGEFSIVTKFKLAAVHLEDKEQAYLEVKNSVLQSCSALKLSQIPICLFHQGSDQPLSVYEDVLCYVLSRLKDEKLIGTGGVSIFDPADVSSITNWNVIQAVQVPMNLFDLRILKEGIMEKLIENNVFVFIRSVFLQGLFFLDPVELPANLLVARKYLMMLQDLSSRSGLTIAQLAVSYVRDTPGVTSLVIGCENLEQLEQNIQLVGRPSISYEIRSEIENMFINVEDKIMTPHYWKD